jgi:hypothetical protein
VTRAKNLPSTEAQMALELVRTLRSELAGTRRLAIAGFGLAAGAIGFAGTLAAICL